MISFFTTEQQILLLKDQALFSDSPVARIRALKDLTKHGINAIPVMEETLDSLPATDVEFRKFCTNAICEIKMMNLQGFQTRDK